MNADNDDRSRAVRSRPPRPGGRFVWPRHRQRLRRSGLAGAVARSACRSMRSTPWPIACSMRRRARSASRRWSTRRIATRRARRLPDRARPGCRACRSTSTSAAIVPRSLIAELIADGGIDAWLCANAPRRVLDLCTGNGSLAVLAALAWPEVEVDAADISADALAVARINVERHRARRPHRAASSPTCSAAVRGRYDLILCNPPYVNARSMAALPAEYRAEPALALAGGADGMDLVRRILRDAPRRMSDAAVLVLEIGHERAHFERAFPRLEVGVAGDQRRRRPGAAATRDRADGGLPAAAVPPDRRGATMPVIHESCSMLVLTVPAPRRQGRAATSASVTLQSGREGRPGRPQRRRQVVAVRAARRPPARRCRRLRRCRRAGASPRSRRTCPRPTRARPISCCEGDTRLMEAQAAARRGRGRPTTAMRMADAHHADQPTPAASMPRPRAQALLLGLGFTVARARRAGRTASPAAGACGCSWRAR